MLMTLRSSAWRFALRRLGPTLKMTPGHACLDVQINLLVKTPQDSVLLSVMTGEPLLITRLLSVCRIVLLTHLLRISPLFASKIALQDHTLITPPGNVWPNAPKTPPCMPI
jgi:hypothetical protein